MLARSWGDGNYNHRLFGNVKWYYHLGKQVSFSFKLPLTLRSKYPTYRQLLQKNKSMYPHKDLYSNFYSSVIHYSSTLYQHKCLPGIWIITIYYSAIKKRTNYCYGIAQVNLKTVTLSDGRQAQKTIYIQCQKRQNCNISRKVHGRQGPKVGGEN